VNELDLIPFRTLLDHVVVPARRHVRETLVPIGLPVAVMSVATAVYQVRWSQSALVTAPDDLGSFFAGCVVLMLLLALTWFVLGMAFNALTVAAMDAVSGREVRMARAWGFVFRPPVFATLVLVGLLDTLSVCAFVLPALYVVPLLSLTLPAMVDEGLVGFDALRRSAELVRFNPTGRLVHSPWLQVFLLLLVGAVLNYAANLVVQMPFVVVQQLLFLRETFSGPEAADAMRVALWLQLPASLLGALASAVTWLYSAFGICLLFRELRRRKEAPDLEEAVERLVTS
jgi:hypothetical protein